jgi:ferredoxin
MSDELIDRDACIGSGYCLYWAPGVFDLDLDHDGRDGGGRRSWQRDVVRVAAALARPLPSGFASSLSTDA